MTKGLPVVGLLAALGVAALSLPTPAAAQTLKVQYRTNLTGATGNQLAPTLSVVNGGSASVALSTLTVRYWFTVDGARSQSFFCDYTPRGCANVTGRFVTMGTATATADTYVEVGFTSGAGSLAAGQSTGEIQLRFAKSDWTSYTQTNDWSFDATKTVLADWSRITLYQNGTRIWGMEPGGGGTTDTTPPTAPANLTSPSKTSTSVSLSWTASTDNVGVTGYDVYRGTTLAGSSTGTSYTATGLTASTAYSFTVRAKDAAGNVSLASAALSVTTSASGTGTPAISVGSSSLSFGTVTLNSSRSQTFAVANTGTAPLDVTMSRASGTSGEFTFSPPSFSLVPGGRKVGVVTYAPTATGTDSGSLVLSTNDPARRTVNLGLSAACANSAYPGCTPTSAGHTTDTNCVSCHSSNPCTSGGVYPGCTAPSTTRHRNRTDCATCHSANPCTSFPYPGCRMPSEDHSGSNANCAQCHRSNPCNDD